MLTFANNWIEHVGFNPSNGRVSIDGGLLIKSRSWWFRMLADQDLRSIIKEAYLAQFKNFKLIACKGKQYFCTPANGRVDIEDGFVVT